MSKSAESNRLAAYKLGVIYSKGEDVDPNKNLSEHYFNIALMNDENGEGVKQGSKKLLSKEVANCSNLHKTLIVNELYDKLQRIAAKKEENERQKEENERQNLIKQRKREEQAKHAELVRKYGTSNAVSIEQGKIRLGFTKQMVEEAWGSPWDVTTIINNNGKFECWIFDVGSYVYFINGVVVQIIN